MYFPYLRGKQFELLALRELVALPLNPGKVIPIIEPVKKNASALKTALKVLCLKNIRVQLIVNPQVGELIGRTPDMLTFIDEQIASGIDNIIPTFLIHSDNDVNLLKDITANKGYDESGYALIHLAPIRRIDELSEFTKASNCLYNSIHNAQERNIRRKFQSNALAILGDYFVRVAPNVRYADNIDEYFSEDVFYFKEEGYSAFSDFQAIGADWSEGGRLPAAVAIHLTYHDPNQDEIRIHHFVSDTNDKTMDIAGKFHEAVTKLVEFCDHLKINSLAIEAFRNLHAKEGFPGLGGIKKLSIMHHIELMQGLI